MKCVKAYTTGEIKRVSEREARRLVGYGWVYCRKEEWKKATRSAARKEKS